MHTFPMNTAFLSKALLVLLLVLSASAVPPSGDALAQTKPDGLVDVGFSDKIEGVETTLDGLLDVLVAHTIMDGTTDKEARFLIVYGIGFDDRVYDAVASVPVNFVPGKKPFIGLGTGPLPSPWQAFEEPVLGFERPLADFAEPLLKFEGPLAPLNVPLAGYDAPQEGLVGIWGTGGTAIPAGSYGLVLFTMPDPSFPGNENVLIQHRAALVPFKAAEAAVPRLASAPPPPAPFAPVRAAAPLVLDGAHPNPFNPTTTIRYALAEAAAVRLAVYDLLGREVALLADGLREAGSHTAVFDAAGLPGGVYLYRVRAGSFARTGRLTLMK